MRIAVVLLLMACDAGKKAPAPTPPPPAQPPPIADAAVVAEPVLLDAAAPHADEWFAEPDTIWIKWVVSPPSVPMKRDPEMLLQPLTVEITASHVTHVTKLAPQLGGLQPYNQAWCHADPAQYPLEKGEVAKITFYEGGAGGYFVRRKGNTLSIYEWNQTDGLCGTVDTPVECPRNEKLVEKFDVNALSRAKIVESILEIDARGDRQPFDCSAR